MTKNTGFLAVISPKILREGEASHTARTQREQQQKNTLTMYSSDNGV